MKELDLQKLTIDVVKAHGGTGRKLSNRFLVGVADLLVKVPEHPAALLEVKLDPIPIKSIVVRPDVTVPQWRFLREFEAAGMPVGVLSFIHRENRWGVCISMGDEIYVKRYEIGKRLELKQLIWTELEEWLKNG